MGAFDCFRILLFVFQMTGAKDRMRQKKMKNQPRNVTYSSPGDVHFVFASLVCLWRFSDVHGLFIVWRFSKRSGITGQWLGQRSSDWWSGLQSRTAQIHHMWADISLLSFTKHVWLSAVKHTNEFLFHCPDGFHEGDVTQVWCSRLHLFLFSEDSHETFYSTIKQ